MRDKLYRFMQGRNGMDDLCRMESGLVLVLLILGIFTRLGIFTTVALLLMIHMYYRALSKNTAKRYEENQKYLNFKYNRTVSWNRFKKRMAQTRDYRFYKCLQAGSTCTEGTWKNRNHLSEMQRKIYSQIVGGGCMFGYINVNGKELSEENKQIYQSYYCGLCRKLREFCGAKGQVLLNYDMTFLVVLLTGLYEPQTESTSFTCLIHPMKKRLARSNEIQDYAAQMNVLLAYYNLVDDWKDDKSYTKKTVAAMLEKDYQCVAKNYPRQAEAIENYIAKLSEYEENKETNIDLVAGLTGEMLGEIFAWKQDEWYDELKTLGFYMGKFIYLMDAYEDLKKDEKKDAYNPLRFLDTDDEQEFEILCRLMMTSMISECARSFERLPILLHADILRNVLYSGVWSKYEYIQLKKKGKK